GSRRRAAPSRGPSRARTAPWTTARPGRRRLRRSRRTCPERNRAGAAQSPDRAVPSVPARLGARRPGRPARSLGDDVLRDGLVLLERVEELRRLGPIPGDVGADAGRAAVAADRDGGGHAVLAADAPHRP